MGELATLGYLQRDENARNALERALRLEPRLSIPFVIRALPITHKAGKAKFIGGLLKAGVPE